MRSLTLGVLTLILMLPSAPTKAGAGRIKGLIASVVEQPAPTMQIMLRDAGTREVRTDNTTAYMKWITHRPWQQETRATRQSLVVGRCVDIEVRPNDTGVAKLVRISDEPAGALFDPCKTLR